MTEVDLVDRNERMLGRTDEGVHLIWSRYIGRVRRWGRAESKRRPLAARKPHVGIRKERFIGRQRPDDDRSSLKSSTLYRQRYAIAPALDLQPGAVASLEHNLDRRGPSARMIAPQAIGSGKASAGQYLCRRSCVRRTVTKLASGWASASTLEAPPSSEI
jgi:hypothetical protein